MSHELLIPTTYITTENKIYQKNGRLVLVYSWWQLRNRKLNDVTHSCFNHITQTTKESKQTHTHAHTHSHTHTQEQTKGDAAQSTISSCLWRWLREIRKTHDSKERKINNKFKFEDNKINRLLSTTDSFHKIHARKYQHASLLSQSRWNIYNHTFHSTAMLNKATHKPTPFKWKRYHCTKISVKTSQVIYWEI